MNRSKIEWCDHTLNIVTGCRHGCQYCYARQMSRRFSGNVNLNKRETDKFRLDGDVYVLDEPFLDETGRQVMYPFGFEPTLHRYRYKVLDKLKMGQNIFVGAMGDLFGDFIPDAWIHDVFSICEAHPKNNYMFLTKNVQRYTDISLMNGDNVFYGTSITTEKETHLFNFLPAFRNRFVSIEPILEDIHPEVHNLMVKQVDWIIIGAETGHRKNKVIPKKSWIDKIVAEADKWGTPVFMKESLLGIIGEENMRRDFPEQLQKKEMSDKVKKRLVTKCASCGKEFRKNSMITVSVRAERGGRMRSLCHVCMECMEKICNAHNLQMPELEQEKSENSEEK